MHFISRIFLHRLLESLVLKDTVLLLPNDIENVAVVEVFAGLAVECFTSSEVGGRDPRVPVLRQVYDSVVGSVQVDVGGVWEELKVDLFADVVWKVEEGHVAGRSI